MHVSCTIAEIKFLSSTYFIPSLKKFRFRSCCHYYSVRLKCKIFLPTEQAKKITSIEAKSTFAFEQAKQTTKYLDTYFFLIQPGFTWLPQGLQVADGDASNFVAKMMNEKDNQRM